MKNKKISVKDKKNLLILIIGVVGIIILIFGISYTINSSSNNNSGENSSTNNNDSNNNENNENNLPVVNVSVFEISNLEMLKNTPNKVAMGFKIVNKSKEKIDNKSLFIKFYEKDKLVHTYEKIITDLNSNDSKYMQVNREFEYKEITKIEFQIGDEVVSLKPNYVD